MRHLKFLSIFFGITLLAGCASNMCKPGIGYALPGTDTAVVGISIDKHGIPQESYTEVSVHPGQKVIYAGPNNFSINFKDKKTPNGRIDNPSENGVVVIEIPKDIFERKEFAEEFRRNKYLTFDYGIRTNGKELDPPLKVYPL